MAKALDQNIFRRFLSLVFFIDGVKREPNATRDHDSFRRFDDSETEVIWGPSLFDFFKKSAGPHRFRLLCFATLKIPLEFTSVLLMAPLLHSIGNGAIPESIQWMIFLCIGLVIQGVNQNHFFHSEILIMNSIERLGVRHLFRSRRPDLVNAATNDLPILTELPIVLAEVYACTGIVLLGVALLFSKVGWASAVAIGLIVALSPLAARLNSRVAKLNDELSDRRNERVQLLVGLHRVYPTLKSLNSEERFLGKLKHARGKEESAMRSMILAVLFPKLIYYFSSALVALGTFAVFVWTGGTISVEVVFSTFLILKIIDFPISSISDLTIMYARTKASYLRLRQPSTKVATQNEGKSEALEAASVEVSLDETHTKLKLDSQLQLNLPHGSMVAVVGPMGGGKSTLLNQIFQGLSQVAKVHLVSQRPFLFRGTIRDNVGLDMNLSIDETIRALNLACLSSVELQGELLDKVVDASGANLSGGQRQRLALARAFASQSEYLILDDSFSALDPKTRNQLFQNLLAQRQKFRSIIFVSNLEAEVASSDHTISVTKHAFTRLSDLNSARVYLLAADSTESRLDENSDQAPEPVSKTETLGPNSEAVSNFWKVLWTYIRSINSSNVPWQLPLLVVLILMGIVAGNLQNSFFQIWSSPSSDLNVLAQTFVNFVNKQGITIPLTISGLGVFAALALVSLILVSLRLVLWDVFTIRGASKLLQSSVASLLGGGSTKLIHIKPHDLDQRLSDDFSLIDDRAKTDVDLGLSSSIDYIIAASMVFLLSIQFLGLYAVFIFIWIVFFTRYLNSSIMIRQQVIETKGRWLGELSSSGESRLAISHAGAESFIFSRLNESLDLYQYKKLQINLISRWFLGFTPVLGAALLLAVLLMMQQSRESAVLTAVAITFSLQQWMILNVVARCLQGIKSYSLSMKRVFDLALESDDKVSILSSSIKSSLNAQQIGLKVEDAAFGYDQSILSVRQLHFLPNQFTLISGKTGAGKSTLIKGLLGMAQRFEGRIIFQNKTVSSMMPFCSYVAQDPVFVESSVRAELQLSLPEQLSDDELAISLNHIGLAWIATKLDADPRKLSLGEQQMLCVVRAVQSRKPILIFDEVTAKLDRPTEIEILNLIKSHSENRIIILVSHRSAATQFADQVVLVENSAAAVV